jgi:hypothetical protein
VPPPSPSSSDWRPTDLECVPIDALLPLGEQMRLAQVRVFLGIDRGEGTE